MVELLLIIALFIAIIFDCIRIAQYIAMRKSLNTKTKEEIADKIDTIKAKLMNISSQLDLFSGKTKVDKKEVRKVHYAGKDSLMAEIEKREIPESDDATDKASAKSTPGGADMLPADDEEEHTLRKGDLRIEQQHKTRPY